MKAKKEKEKIADSTTLPPTAKLIKSENLFPVVGIGASAGGLDAFKKLLRAIPEDSGMAYVLVQHLDPTHESMLPELLQKVTNIPVLEIADDIKVLPNHIYVIPSNKMMVATNGVLLLSPRPPKSKTERNLPIDLFFTSLAEVHQAHAIGVVLSGTASDGTLGLKAIKDHGGITFAQDEASAAYDSMPHNAAMAGVVDFILPPEKIPEKLLEIIGIINGNSDEEENLPLQEEAVFKQIISLLRIRKGTDFTYYKQSTIRRRILRRMVLNKNEAPADYLQLLRENKPEQDLLFQDLLIPVTSFFRDEKSFDNLCEAVFPQIANNKAAGEPIRIWVAGCSTGEEAYSIAICLKEYLGENQRFAQIFATDLSEPAITKARHGIYTKNELKGVSPQRLNEFFTKTNGSYQVKKNVRDMCVFALHNFLKDPPFGKMDFISCRNVLIYMEPYLQKKALTTFHYALNPKGFLLLGKSETTGGVPDLFASAAKNDKLYSRKNAPGKFVHVASQRSEQHLNHPNANPSTELIRTDFQKTADDILLRKYTPAGVVVNEALDIVHFRGNTSSYLEQSPGKPTHNLIQLAKNGLAFELRNILHKTKKEKAPVIKESIPMEMNGSLRYVNIEAMPLPNTIEPYYLVLFHDTAITISSPPSLAVGKKSASKTTKDDRDLRIQQLEQELAQTREDMRSITEDQEAANEELQSANEELLSGSEELQSLNEELETGKEELQSTNEELIVVNQEMLALNEQLTTARDYAEAIIVNIREPLLVLDKKLRIKTANHAFYKTFRVNELETEGVLVYDIGNQQWDIPALRTLLEKILPEKSVFNDFEVTHTFTAIGERVMLLNAREVINKNSLEKLILLSIDDITEKVSARKKIEDTNKRYHTILMESPFAFSIMKGKEMLVTHANKQIKEFWGKGNDVEGKTLLQVLPELADQPFPAMLDSVYTTGKPVYANEILARLNHNGKIEERYFNIVYQPHFEADETISGVITVAHEVTNQVLARKQIEDSNKRYNMMVMQSPFAFAVLKGKDMVITLANDSIKDMWGKGKEIEDKPLLEVLPEIIDQPFPTLLNKVYTTGIPYYANDSLVHLVRNGKTEEVYFNFVYQPYREADETISGVAIIATEVSPQAILNKKIKESEERFQAAIAAVEGILWTNNAKGEMEGEQLGWSLLTGQSHEEYQGYGWVNAVHPDDAQPTIDAWYEAVRERTNFIFKHRVKIKNGTWRHFSICAIPLLHADGVIREWVGVHTDITAQYMADNALIESENRFRQLAELMPQKVWTADAYGNKTYFNQTLLDYAGMTFEELKDRGWEQIIHPEDWEKNKRHWEDSISTGKRYEAENRFLRKDGKYLWHLSLAVPLKDEDGKIKMWLGSKTEIQAHKEQKAELEEAVYSRTIELEKTNKELEEKQQELLLAKEQLLSEYSRSLIEASLDPLVTINANGKITDMNKAFSSITDISQQKLVGTDFSLYFTDPQKARELQAAVFSKGVITNYPLTIIDGEPTEVLFNGSIYKDENTKLLGAVLVARDITEQKRVEKELMDAKVFAELATELSEDAKIQAEKSAKMANEAVHAKQQFLSNMSHEIRTPMNAIIGFTKVILKTELSAKQKEYLTAIKLSGDALIVLINDILDLAKVDAGKMTFEQIPFKMAASITSMIHLFEIKTQEKNLNLVKEYDPKIPKVLGGDPVRLHQIILNLLSNAVKFTTKGEIKLSVRLLEEDESQATIEFAVSDTGIGISAEKLELIFDNFHQATSSTGRLFGGTGLGLAIVKKLVEQQGGSIYVKSKVDEGSTFSFILKFQKTKMEVIETTALLEFDTEIKNIKVLVAEDMALNQLLMKTLLDDFGFERDIVTNGKIAIEKLQNKSYDIILMDLQMPEMNGFEATEYIRNTLNSKIPIIALTADVTTVDMAKCKAVGMNDYISKPVDERLLYEKIIALVKKPSPTQYQDTQLNEDPETQPLKYTDLTYLSERTQADPSLIMEMISIYLEQTPPIITAMRQSAQDEDWSSLYAAVHKLIPSFLIVGINNDFEKMARELQEFASTRSHTEKIPDLVFQLENVCTQACKELEMAYNSFKTSSDE